MIIVWYFEGVCEAAAAATVYVYYRLFGFNLVISFKSVATGLMKRRAAKVHVLQ